MCTGIMNITNNKNKWGKFSLGSIKWENTWSAISTWRFNYNLQFLYLKSLKQDVFLHLVKIFLIVQYLHMHSILGIEPKSIINYICSSYVHYINNLKIILWIAFSRYVVWLSSVLRDRTWNFLQPAYNNTKKVRFRRSHLQIGDTKSVSTKWLLSKAENLEENNIKLFLKNKIVLNLTNKL